MELQRFHRVEDFARQSQPFLLAHEAEHNLILGLCSNLMQQPMALDGTPYFALVDQNGAPIAAAMRTPPFNLILSRVAAPEALTLLAADVYQEYGGLPGLLAPAGVAQAFAERWQALSGRPFRRRTAERIYQLDRVLPVRDVPGTLRKAEQTDRSLLVEWLTAFYQEAENRPAGRTLRALAERSVDSRLHHPFAGFYLWDNGAARSLAGYSGPTPSGIRIGPVYTPPDQRGHGYASATVAGLSQLLLERGYRRCFLFTNLANPTANKIYQAIGYRPVADADEYAFEAPG